MTATARRIEQELRELPLEDLLTLHENILTSIHAREDAGQVDAAFHADILRRVKEIESGNVEGIDALGALKEM